MSRDLTRNRMLLLLLLALNAAWMYCAGSQIAFFVRNIDLALDGFDAEAALVVTGALLVLVRAWQLSLTADMAAQVRMTHARLVGVLELIGLSLALLGATWGFGSRFRPLFTEAGSGTEWATWEGLIILILGCAAIPPLARTIGSGRNRLPEPEERWFFLDWRHISNRLALCYLAAGVLLLGLIGAGAAARFAQADWRASDVAIDLPAPFPLFGLALLIGVAISTLQFHWHRAIGFVPWAFLLLIVGFLGLAINPAAHWPLLFVGLAAVGHVPLMAGLVAALPSRQRFATLCFYQLAATVFAVLLAGSVFHSRRAGLQIARRFSHCC